MGGKHRHTQDRMFITATEWKSIGGKKEASNHAQRPLPFDHCSLSLAPIRDPVCTVEGVLFDIVNLAPYLKIHKKNPVTGDTMSAKDIVRLNMCKNAENQWHCPVTCKVFNSNSHVVAIKSSGYVYSYEAVNELNLKMKSYLDLTTGAPFVKSDIITLQNPSDEGHCKLRDISNFVHLKQVRDDTQKAKASEGSVRHSSSTSQVMKELKVRKVEEGNVTNAKFDHLLSSSGVSTKGQNHSDVADLLALNALSCDVSPGNIQTNQKASSSLTSTSSEVWTSNATRPATVDELREARWRKLRQMKQKGYVQLQTNMGNMNMEIHCDSAPRTSWNFITLCEREYYNNTVFHRLIKGFMVQGGDPEGTGSGGDSAFGVPFFDEFDSRLMHDKRGVLSMANSGTNTNGSQFFITFAATKHLDLKHGVFGSLVGGMSTLDQIEEVGSNKKETPLSEIKVISVTVFSSPLLEAEELLKKDICDRMAERLKVKADQTKVVSVSLPSTAKTTPAEALSNVSAINTVGKRPVDDISRISTPAEGDQVARFMQSEGGFYSSNASTTTKTSLPTDQTAGIAGTLTKKAKMHCQPMSDFSGW